MNEQLANEWDLRVHEEDNGDWNVYDRAGVKIAGPFPAAMNAAEWARIEVVRRHEMDAPCAEYLRDLAKRLMAIPVMYGVDQSDVDELNQIARRIERENGQ